MRRLLPTVLFLTGVSLAQEPTAPPAAARAADPVPPAGMASIHKRDLLAHATFLASDELGGRLTGSPGQEAAAKYIAREFERLGLEPLGDEVDGKRGFFQYYGIKRTRVEPRTHVKVGDLELRTGFAVLGGQPTDLELSGKVVFCGLGRVRGSQQDLAEGERLDGAIAVVAFRGQRGSVDKQLSVEQKFGMSFGVFGRLGKTAREMANRGAAAVWFVQVDDRIGISDVLNYLAAAPGKDVLAPAFQGGDNAMGGMAQMLASSGVPTLILSVPASQQVLGSLGIAVEDLRKFVEAEGERPTAKADLTGALNLLVTHDDQARASNVCAVLRGSDPALAEEAVVYSAHMDHVGTRIDGEVFNGADDNASGSAGLLAIAKAFATGKERPRRSVVFLSVSGEELGLWGSAYYAENPTWPLDKLVADINTDMIGRSGPESGAMEVTVTPSHKHSHFSTIVQDAARFGSVLGLTFSSGDKYYQRSDHYNFAKKGIPVVFFCNGEHEDYHQVTDHADKLDGDKMERIARLAFWTGWSVANSGERPRKLGRSERWF